MTRQRYFRRIVFFTILLLIIGYPSFFCFPSTEQVSQAQGQGQEREITSQRTQNTRTYDLGEGKFKTVSQATPLHYQNSQGDWLDVDTNIKDRSEDREFDKQSVKNTFKTYFKNNVKGSNVLKLSDGQHFIKFKIEDSKNLGRVKNSTAITSENSIIYPDLYDKVDLKYTISSTEILEEFIVKDQSTALRIDEIKEGVTLGDMTYQEEDDGSLSFFDGEGNLLWKVPPPVMYEFNDRLDRNYGLHYVVSQDQQKIYISKVIDQEGKNWLQDPEREYPIVIDLTAGPNSPGTVVDDSSFGALTWANPDNAKTSNNLYAQASAVMVDDTHYLKATDFGFSIPSGATIDGIEAEVELYATNIAPPYDIDQKAQIVQGGTIMSTNKAAYTTLPSIEEYISYGGSSDLWGETWDYSDINNSGFGFAWAGRDNSGFCLNKETLISTPLGEKKIKEINENDIIYSFDMRTGGIVQDKVLKSEHRSITNYGSRYYYIYYSNSEKEGLIKATLNHQFYVEGEYIFAQNLKVGDRLLDIEGNEMTIDNVAIVQNDEDEVWDLVTENYHNFIANGILVHDGEVALGGDHHTIYVDHIRITVYYSSADVPTNVSITGIAYTDDNESTAVTEGTTVRVAVNGSLDANSDTTDASGNFTITEVSVNSGDTLTVFFDGGSVIGSTITITDETDITTPENFRIYQNHVVVRYETGSAINIAQIAFYDNDQDSDINFDAEDNTPDTLTVEDGSELYIPSGYTFQPGGNLKSGSSGIDDIEIVGTYIAASNEEILVSGSWKNSGTFTASTSTVTFDASSTDKTIEAGASSFSTVVFNNASGGWTIQTNDMTTANDFTLTAANDFTLDNERTLEVQGTFTNSVGGAATTWTSSTLYINSETRSSMNTETDPGDTYATLQIGANTDIDMWSSQASTYTIDATGSLYSQDHASTDCGDLYIWGDYHIPNSTVAYWNYAKDFDGTDLSGSERQVNVRLAADANVTAGSGETLQIIGDSSNHTTVSRQSAGNYGLDINGGAVNAQYFDFDHLDASGLNISNSATVTELSHGSFDNAGAGAASSYITIAGTTSTDHFTDITFDDNGDGADTNVVYNVNADGSGVNWIFDSFAGNKAGDDYDNETNGAYVGWYSILSLTISDNTMDLGLVTTATVKTDQHTITVSSSAINGYTCSVVEDGNLRDNGNDINDVADNTVTAGSEEYGITTSGSDGLLGNDQAISEISLDVACNAGPVTESATTIIYKTAVSSSTLTRHYSHVVTYTCVAEF